MARGTSTDLSVPPDVRVPLESFSEGVMDFRDYLAVATTLANEATEAAWRSAISRAYYAAFHVACQLLANLGFRVPRADRAHGYVWMRLSNSGETDVERAG